MVKVYLIIEGGDTRSGSLSSGLREAFHKLLDKAGVSRRPRIIIAGGRSQAYDEFKTKKNTEPNAISILLIDSECPVEQQYMDKPWDFLKAHEHWDWLPYLEDKCCHLMVQCMEAWFFADQSKLADYYGTGFRVNRLPQGAIESIPANDDNIPHLLNNAARGCRTIRNYDKGRDSYEILKTLEPQVISEKSPWAKRFFDGMRDI